MKTINVSKDGSNKLKKGIRVLYLKDLIRPSSSYIPGEWVLLKDENSQINYLAFINLEVVENYPVLHILRNEEDLKDIPNVNEVEVAKAYIIKNIGLADKRRKKFKCLEHQDQRLIYGENDGLPGLIVDKYHNIILVQINTAGLDRFRELIASSVSELYPDIPVHLYDHQEYRKAEVLPKYEDRLTAFDKKSIDKIFINENGFQLEVSSNLTQKIGYYFDHRANRKKMERLISSLNINFERGLDLFSYIGSWGLHQLRAGVKNVTFVDQGKFALNIESNLKLNGFTGRGDHISDDVYNYLDRLYTSREQVNSSQQNIFFDIVTSDPPAFAKSIKNKEKALSGYQKLHEKIIHVLAPQALLIICSCTNCVTLEDLDLSVQEAVRKVNQKNQVWRKIQLLDVGIEGMDHPVSSLKDSAHYLKYLAYWVEY